MGLLVNHALRAALFHLMKYQFSYLFSWWQSRVHPLFTFLLMNKALWAITLAIKLFRAQIYLIFKCSQLWCICVYCSLWDLLCLSALYKKPLRVFNGMLLSCATKTLLFESTLASLSRIHLSEDDRSTFDRPIILYRKEPLDSRNFKKKHVDGT